MNKDEILNSLTQIGTCEDEVERRTMLNTLRDEVSTLFDNVSDLTEQNTELTTANENLRCLLLCKAQPMMHLMVYSCLQS